MYLKWIKFFFLFAATLYAGSADLRTTPGSKTAALNGLYFAGYDGINGILNNPASLSFADKLSIHLTATDKVGQYEFVNSNGDLHRSFIEDNFNFSGGLVYGLDNLSLALGYFPVVDYNIGWPYVFFRARNNTSVLSAFSFSNSLMINSVTPAAAFRMGNITLGLTANIYLARFKPEFPLSNNEWLNNRGLPGYQFSYNTDGIGYGAGAGINWDASADLKLGASVRIPVSIDLDGSGKSNMFAELDSTVTQSNLKSKFELPLVVNAGILYSFNQNFNFNIDFSYSLWKSTQKEISFEIDNEIWRDGLAGTDSITGINGSSINLSFENSFDAGIGMEYFPGSGLVFRAGYRYSKSPVSESSISLLFPGVDSHNFSAGIGHSEDNYSIDASVNYSSGIRNNFTNKIIPVRSGQYDSGIVIPALTINYKF